MYDDNGNVITDDNGIPVDASHCSGCWEKSVELLKEIILKPWLKANGATEFDWVLAKIEGATWQRISGSFISQAYELFSGRIGTIERGEYQVLWTLDGRQLRAVRSSHDEPTGAPMTFEFTSAPLTQEVGEF
jgi:hypothetical protein